jgi:hypothetical protein
MAKRRQREMELQRQREEAEKRRRKEGSLIQIHSSNVSANNTLLLL